MPDRMTNRQVSTAEMTMVIDIEDWKRKRVTKTAGGDRGNSRRGAIASSAIVGALAVGSIVPAVRIWSLHHAAAIVLVSLVGWGLCEMGKSAPGG